MQILRSIALPGGDELLSAADKSEVESNIDLNLADEELDNLSNEEEKNQDNDILESSS